MRKRMRQGLAYLLLLTLLFMSVPVTLHASTGDDAPIVIDNILNSTVNEGVMSVVGLSEGNTGVLYGVTDNNWTTFKVWYKVFSTAGSVLSDVDISALMGARATNVSTFAAYAIADGKAVITWEGTNNGCGGAYQFAIIDEDGTVVKGPTDISTVAAPYNCYTGATELSNGDIAFMWQNVGDEYLYRIFDAHGNAITNPESVEKGGTRQDNFAHNSTYTHSLSANDQGQFLITYDIYQNSNYIGAMYDNDGTRKLTNGVHHFYLAPKPSNARSYAIGLSGGKFGISYVTNSNISMDIIDNQGAVQASIASGLVHDDLAGGALPVKDGGFLVYDTSTVGTTTHLYTKHYSSDGTLLKDWTQRGTDPVIDYFAGYYTFAPYIFSGYESGFGFYNLITNQLYLYDIGSASPPETPVAIVDHPADSTISAGDNASFAVTATDATSYQWQVDTGSGYSNLTDDGLYSGVTTDTLFITNVPLSMDGYMYRVIVSGAATSTDTSNGASLTVLPLVDAAAPSIDTQPANQNVNINGTATLTVSASVSDSGSLSYQWFSNTTNSNSGGTLIAGANSATYSPPTGTTGLTYYYVVVTNTNASATGATTATTVSDAASVAVNSTFTVTPVDNIAFEALNEGYTATETNTISETITLTKVGNGAISNMAVHASGGAGSKFTIGTVQGDALGAGVQSTSFTVRPVTGLSPGTHTETVTITADGGLSESLQISFTVHPTTFTVSETGTVTFNSLNEGYTTSQVNGIKKGITLTKVGSGAISNLAVSFSGGASSSFTTGTVLSDSLGAGVLSTVFQVFPKTGLTPGTYTETVTITADGGISHSFQVSFTVVSVVHAATPVIVTQPSNETVDKGANVTLSVGATISDSGTLNYQWFRNTTNSTTGGIPIVDANSATYDVPTNAAGTFYYYVGVININNNVNGTKTASTLSHAAEVNVLVHAAAPSIMTQPSDEVMNVGDSKSLSVVAMSGDGGTLSYQWYRNTASSNTGGTLIPGADSASYEVPTNTAGTFYYYVVVTNTNNNVNGTKTATAATRAVEVTVLAHAAAPSITMQPADESVHVGNSKSLSVGATSGDGGTLSYQWYRNTTNSTTGGTLIAGANSATYDVPTNTAGTFYYYVVVTNTNNNVNGTKTASTTSRGAEVKVSHTYTVEAISDLTAKELTQGYASSEVETVVIKNNGTGALANVAITLSGGDADHFVVTQPDASLHPGASASFSIQAKEGLAAATYKVTVTISATNMTNASFAFTQKVVLPDPPAKPQQVTATSGNAQMTMAWDVVQGATFYQVYRVTGENQYSLIDTVTAASYTANSLVNGTEYTFVVKAGNPGGLSDYSNEVRVTPMTVPGVPRDVRVLAGDQQARVTFTAPASNGGSEITGYEVINEQGDVVATGNASPITVNGLTNGVTYSFTVRAINSVGKSELLPYYSVTPRSTPISVPTTPADDTVEVIVNGQVQNAGTLKKETIDGKLVATILVDEAKIMERLAAEGKQAVITIPFPSGSDVVIGEWNGQLMKALEDNEAKIVIRNENGAYTLPSTEIDIEALAAKLGAGSSLKDVKLLIKIAKPSHKTVKDVENAIKANGLAMVAAPLEFTISAVYGDATIEIMNFNAYVQRTIMVPEGVDPVKMTTGVVIEEDGSIRHVPTQVESKDGQYYAHINSLTNSVYSVVWNTVAYEDAVTHWASKSIHNMGARLVVNGVSDGRFAPDRNITRAEFAAIVVRALGLKLQSSQGSFTDVEQSAWYSSVVQTAYAYGIISGFQDGMFRPQDTITREQAMLILAKAMKLTGLKGIADGSSGTSIVAAYKDGAQVASWAVTGVADAVSSGIVSGRMDASLAPQAAITRAEVAVMIERLLQNSGLINKEQVK
ncbi:S-layer homology domain-containing protein [Paenibacillus sp. NPDC057967]|uniref:S-layer homology domain-containing protein n=1 Tax=Paenibacillus sp. NPDC057967 TaxID=3346293 RepID=UPI0036DD6088